MSAYSGGTGFSSGNLKKHTSSSYSDSNTTTQTASSSSSSKSKKNSSSSNDDNKDYIDWIEVKLDRIERKIQQLKNTADNAYKTFSSRNKALNSEISSVTFEIGKQEEAYERYMEQADSVGLKSSLKKKVRNGTIDINKYKESTRELIEEYQKWYLIVPSYLVTGGSFLFNCWN